MRKKFRDIQLDDLLTEMKLCAADGRFCALT